MQHFKNFKLIVCKVQSTNSNHGSKSSRNVAAVKLWQNQFYSIGPYLEEYIINFGKNVIILDKLKLL